MKFLIISLAVSVTLGVFIYTLSFVRWLFQHRQYRGGAGVFILGVVAVVIPMYVLFFKH